MILAPCDLLGADLCRDILPLLGGYEPSQMSDVAGSYDNICRSQRHGLSGQNCVGIKSLVGRRRLALIPGLRPEVGPPFALRLW